MTAPFECPSRKQPFLTYVAADKAARAMNRRHSGTREYAEHYRCRECGARHLTHVPPKSVR